VDKHYVQQFQRAFSGLTVKAVADANTPQKLLTEALAGRHEADVVWWPIGGLLPLAQRDLLARLEAEALAAAGIGPDDVTLDGRALKVANVIYTIEYDTRRLRREDLPRTWEDLLAPRWPGRIVGATLLVPGVPATIGMLKGEGAALAFARALRDTAKVTMVPSSAVAREMLHRGEKDLMISLVSEVLKRKHQYREPVDWAPVSPTYSTQHVVAVLARAPHPRAARLFALWAASPEGKVAMEKASFDADARPGAPTELARMVREAGLELLIEDAQNAGPRAALYRQAREILLGEAR
jgi:ABC-type Fe3+ transport system substrate-binding protein